jgi:type VI secretion system secreted protein Hcp
MSIMNMFLKLDPSVRGEATEPGHENEMTITGWSWGMTTSDATGTGRRGLSTALSELKIVRWADSASTGLMSVMRRHSRFDAILSVRKAGEPPFDYFVVKIGDGRITSYDVGAMDSPDLLSETLTIAFEKIEVLHKEQDAKGQAKATSTFSTDVSAKS